MIHKNIKEVFGKSFPVIIVGSGPAGITLALSLEQSKIDCLIIEAGNEEYTDESQENYAAKIIGDQITDLRYSRLRQLGGTSGHWGGWCKPIEKWNIEKWGIEYNSFSKLKDQTCKILEIENNFQQSKISNFYSQIQFQYSKVRFGDKYKNHLSNSKHIHLLVDAQVTHFSGENKIFESISVSQNNENIMLNSNFFILCTGGIENSRILLWSKEKDKSLINNNLPIGKYWITHPWIIGGVGFLYKSKIKKILNKNFINYDGPMHIATNSELVNEKKILSGAMYMNAKEDTKLYKEIIKDFLCVAPEYGKKIAKSIFGKDLKCGNIFMNLEEPPKEANKITLDKKIIDKNGVPITNLYYKKSKETLNSAKTILVELGKLFVEKDIGRIALKSEIENLESYENLGVHHHMGGTRIGNNFKTSVVDSNLKLHDLKNCYILGSSVFPTGGYSNPTFSIVQLALRLAEHLEPKIT